MLIAPAVRSIEGWVFEDNVVRFLEHVSRYPIAGTSPLTVSLARAIDGSVVSVRVQGEIDPVLTARLETLLDLL